MASGKDNTNQKSPYTLISNIGFIMGKIWSWDKGKLFLLGLQIPLQVLFPFIGILLPKAVIDSLTKGVSPQRLALTIIGFTSVLIVLNVGDRFIEGMKKTIAQYIRTKFTFDIFYKMLCTDYENAESSSGQRKLQRSINFTYNNSAGGEACVQSLGKTAVNILGLLLYGYALVSLSPIAAFILTAISIINFISSRAVSRYEYKRKDEAALLEQKINYISRKTGEPESAKDIRIYNIADWFISIYKLLVKVRMAISGQIERRRLLSQSLAGLLYFIRDCISYGYLILLVLNQKITAADFTFYVGAVAGFSRWMDGLFSEFQTIYRVSLECTDYRTYLDIPEKLNHGKGAVSPEQVEQPPEIIFDNVSFRYPDAQDDTIKCFNLNIKKGERIALVGLNGAGKTTIVKLLTGLYRPTSGRLLMNGTNAALFNRDEYYDLFSAVFQEFLVLASSVASNVALKAADGIEPEQVEAALRAAELWDKVSGLPDGMRSVMRKDILDHAVEFSGGELQRLMLARALYKKAPVLILDEPTAALDPIAENRTYQKYRDMTREHTSVYISHRFASTRFCDRIVFIENGMIAEIGTHAQLMEKGGKYAEMFEIQRHYYKENLCGQEDESCAV